MRKIALWLLAAALPVLAGCASSSDPAPGSGNAVAPAGGNPPASSSAKPAATSPSDAGKAGAERTAPKVEPKKSLPPPSRIGDVRISLFTIAKGKASNQYMGNYLMLVNRGWVDRKRSYQEAFWAVAKPNIKIIEDDVMEKLLQVIQDSGYYNMPQTPKVDAAELKRPQVESIRYVSVNRDGQERIVERERVSSGSGLLTKFVDIEFAINQVWHASQTYVTETKKQNWQDAFQNYLDLRKGQDPQSGKTGGTPGGTSGQTAPTGSGKEAGK